MSENEKPLSSSGDWESLLKSEELMGEDTQTLARLVRESLILKSFQGVPDSPQPPPPPGRASGRKKEVDQ